MLPYITIDPNPAENFSALVLVTATTILYFFLASSAVRTSDSIPFRATARSLIQWGLMFFVVAVLDYVKGDGVAIMLFVLLAAPISVVISRVHDFGIKGSVGVFIVVLTLWMLTVSPVFGMPSSILLLMVIGLPMFAIVLVVREWMRFRNNSREESH
jgi:glucan phosphoethanolaminetransferase (alkaline phosphatase superfamily)